MMPLGLLRQFTQVYLAAPYTLAKDRDAAADECARIAGELLLEEIATYPATVVGHALCKANDALDPHDQDIWERLNETQMDNSGAMVVLDIHGWDMSLGIAKEIDYFRKAAKPIFWINPLTLELR